MHVCMYVHVHAGTFRVQLGISVEEGVSRGFRSVELRYVLLEPVLVGTRDLALLGRQYVYVNRN